MKILAFDLATLTGGAYGVAGARPTAFTVDLGKGRSDAARFAKALRMTDHYVKQVQPDLVVIEQPVVGKAEGSHVSLLLISIRGCVKGQVARHKIRLAEYPVQSVRKHFLGKHLTRRHFPHLKPPAARAEIKRLVQRRCQSLGWKAANTDEADALALWDYACALESADHAMTSIGGMFRHG